VEIFQSTYNTHPVHVFPWLAIQQGHTSLAERLLAFLRETPHLTRISLDGFVGLEWPTFISGLQAALASSRLEICWLSTEECLLPCEQIGAHLHPFLTDDPVFGRLFRGHLEELWDVDRVASFRRRLAESHCITIVYGFGASQLVPDALQVYIDVPKDRGQELARQRRITNVGAPTPMSFGEMYKRMYFVDWPMLNRIKRMLLPRLALFVDGTQSSNPRWIEGAALRAALHELAQRPFRMKPWFAPGPWGGQWMKEHFDLPREQPNYAWSFEVIAPENGILLGDGRLTLECPFDLLLWQETDAVLGPAVAARYGSYFPLRFDYLDTMGGTNLSCQVHPRLDYIRDEFGEPFTQDETYYILTCGEDARVFLGLREDADLERFRAAAYAARDQAVPFDINEYVNSVPSKPHDLFLIPSGTVHCSGANNVVLEISATPYIYTFKIYDYLRSDLSGSLRPVHLEHAFANIESSRRASWVGEHLMQEPVVVREGETWRELCIGNLDRLFFSIHRLEFTDSITDQTNGRFLMLNLVEGELCEIRDAGGEAVPLHYAESIIVPASLGTFTLRNTGEQACKVVKAFVK
jgi:mannose-6-phosphate isomerase class I